MMWKRGKEILTVASQIIDKVARAAIRTETSLTMISKHQSVLLWFHIFLKKLEY